MYIAYEVEDCIIRLEVNFRSLDQTLEAMRGDIGEVKLDGASAREIVERFDGYDNTLNLLRENIKNLFEELHAIVESDGEMEEETEKEREEKDEGEERVPIQDTP